MNNTSPEIKQQEIKESAPSMQELTDTLPNTEVSNSYIKNLRK